MIIRKFHLLIAAHLICTSLSQNARSYDTNDWIPITQKTSGEDPQNTKKATGRVLNLDTPAQKFFPDEFLYKKSRPNFQSRPPKLNKYNVPKYENTYKFEMPPPLPQNVPPPKFQYLQLPQEVQLPNYQQPPPLDIYRPHPPRTQYVPNAQAIRAPPPNQPITYHQYQQLPPVPAVPQASSYNTTYYQTINPVSINQELVGSFQYQNLGQEKPIIQNLPKVEGGNEGKDNVQLVYVPLENLKGEQAQVQPVPQDTQNIYRQVESPRFENPVDKPHRLAAIEQDFIQQALQATRLQEQIQQGQPIYYQVSSTTTTPKPLKNKKPHQPPLAFYIEGEKQKADITDVLSVLHDIKTIAVQDSIQPGSPQIFIGPNNLESPEYSKFPLPYLNSVDGNRINRKFDSLPFFVAPLSFKAPPGYSKIPLPAPHVGSVLISNKEDLHGKRSTPRPNQLQTESIKQFGKDVSTPVTQKPDTLTPQPYLGQTYYDPNSFVSSPQPQLLQFAVNDQNKQYNIPMNSYNPSIVGNEYSLPLQSQPEVTSQIKDSEISYAKNIPDSSFRYNFRDEQTKTKNSYNQPKPTEQVAYNTPTKGLSYTGPQTYEQDDKRTYQQDDYNVQKPNEDQYRLGGQQNRYEPISTTFGSNIQREQEVVNIKPKAETAPKQTSNSYVTESQQKPRVPDVSPLELAINEFELHQINTQLEEKPRTKNQYNYKTQASNEESDYRFDPELHRFSSTPASILRDTYETSTRPSTKPKNRVRARPKTTTLPPPESEPYTVLEEFSIKQKQQSYPEQPNIQYYNQQVESETEQIPSQQKFNNPSYSSQITEIENVPTKVYNLNPNKQTTQPPPAEYSYTLNQQLMDQQILQSGLRQSSPAYEQQGQFEVDPHQYTIQPNIDTTKGQIQYTQDSIQYTQDTTRKEEDRLNEYTSSLEDPSVRTLLIPKLLVPTTTNDELYTGPTYLPTTEKIEKIRSTTTTSTTERPVETTTQSRVRTRTRGGSRFNTHTTTKRPATRRRPSSRVTTERSAVYSQDNDQKSTITKSRFRTRGRTTPNTITERQSTTENEIREVATEEPPVKIRTHPDGSESYIEYEHSVDTQKIVPVESTEQEYPRFYSTSSRPILQYDNTASTPKPNINVLVSHPDDEEGNREKVRVRGRVRDRPRSSTTSTERVVTRRITSKPTTTEKEDSGEFYGFFRQPDFGPPAETRAEIPTTTPRHRIYSYQTPSQHGEDYQLNLDNTHIETSTVKFIGEIVPKYTTSKEVVTETETPKPRIRTRTRAPQKKVQSSHKENQDSSTRRSNIIRSRGKSHYKIPENLKKNKEDDDDIEGGNYPVQYLQGRRAVTTPSPNFQITVAPEDEDDQALNPSLYRPNVVSPEEWHDASEYDPEEERRTATNILETEETPSKLNSYQAEQPYALPVKAITEKIVTTTPATTSDETFKQTTKEIEQQFEAINNFDTEKNTEPPTEKPTKQKRRKGVWKLVKQRPVDRLEASESQNYLTVLNSFHDIEKVESKDDLNLNEKPVIEENEDKSDQIFEEELKQFENKYLDDKTEKIKATYAEITTILPEKESITTQTIEDKITTTQPEVPKIEEKEEDFLDSIYEMFGMARAPEQKPEETEVTPPVTTTLNPTFPEELTELPSNSSSVNSTENSLDIETTTIPLEDYFTTPQLEAKHEIKTSTFDVEPWNMKEVRTSTSTEISHETEICYKGRCIRSHDQKKRV